MNYPLIKQSIIIIASALPLYAGPVVYSEDFSAATLPSTTQANLGGRSSLATYGEISVASSASIVDEALLLSSTSGFRGIGIAFEAGDLLPAGSYSLTLDITNFELTADRETNISDSLRVNIFTGNDFETETNTNDRIYLNAQTGELQERGGSGTSNLVITENYNFTDDPNTGSIELNFDYDGSDALAIFVGAVSDGYPHPNITVDNITLTSVDAVPEPSSALLLSLSSLILLRRKR
ncbi:MAG: PEP-CTERM sorting domain-containing protein [Akkermansiaceae bacterium]